MYGLLINGTPLPAPNPLHINGAVVYNPPDNTYAATGYKPIIATPYPDDDGNYYTPSWVEQDGQIVQVWTPTDPPEPEPVPPSAPTTEERLAALEAAMLAVMGGGADV